jgi:hypothetical protein
MVFPGDEAAIQPAIHIGFLEASRSSGFSAVLFLTTPHWTKWVLGIVCYCLVKAFVGAPVFALFGNISVAKKPAFIAIDSSIALSLTWRHFERA